MKNLIRRIQGKAIPKETVCNPQVWRLRVWLRGDTNPLSYRQVGEADIKKARNFISDIMSAKGADWWQSETMCVRRADISLIKFERIE